MLAAAFLTTARVLKVTGVKVEVPWTQSAPVLVKPVAQDVQTLRSEHVAHLALHGWHPVAVGKLPAAQLLSLKQTPFLRVNLGWHVVQNVADPEQDAQGDRQLSQAPIVGLKY